MTDILANRKKAWFWLSLFLMALCQCNQTDNQPTPSSARQPTTQLKTSTSLQATINSIPETIVAVTRLPKPLRLTPGGLRFQFDQNQKAQFQYFKPIGDAKFGPDGSLYISFPEKHAVVRFVPPEYDLEFFGHEQAGGRNQAIGHPDTLAFWNQRIQVTNTRKGQVMVFDSNFELETLHQVHIRDPIPGPDEQFLIRSDDRPDLFFRATKTNKISNQYMVPIRKELPGEKQILRFHIQPNWDIVAVNVGANDLFHLQANGQFRLHFRLDFEPVFGSTPLRLDVVQLEGDSYWLLFHTTDTASPATFLAAITIEAKVRFLWEVPFFCDGLHLTHDRLVLFDRKAGKAQIFLR